MPTSVSSDQKCWHTVSRCGQVWRMCSGVCSSEPHSQWAESARPNLFRCCLSPHWPVCRRKMVVWVLLSRVLIWSFCGHIHCLFFTSKPNYRFLFHIHVLPCFSTYCILCFHHHSVLQAHSSALFHKPLQPLPLPKAGWYLPVCWLNSHIWWLQDFQLGNEEEEQGKTSVLSPQSQE